VSRQHPILRFRFVFKALTIVAAFLTGRFGSPRVAALVIVLLLLITSILTYYEYEENRIQPATEALQTVLEEKIFPRFVSEYARVRPSPPEIRLNVMLLYRRNWRVWNQTRRVWPWQRTLKIEAAHGDYESYREMPTEWKTHEGIAGAAVNKKSNEVWSGLDDSGVDAQTKWHMTDEQYTRTQHLDSVLSVPIYLPSDESKTNPVGVLNLDSEAPLFETGFDENEVRGIAIYYANLIGAIVE
jgi:hypothetical protein